MHEERITALDRRIDVLSQKVDDFIEVSRRNADREDARMAHLENHMDATNQHINETIASFRNLTVAAMVGVGGMSIALIFAVVFK